MKNLFNYNDYLNDKILEAMDLKISKLDLILSKRMIKILKEMNHVIADELLRLHLDDEPQFQVTFVDLGSEPDKVSFIQANKVPELVEPDIVHGSYNKEKDEEGKMRGTSPSRSHYCLDLRSIAGIFPIGMTLLTGAPRGGLCRGACVGGVQGEFSTFSKGPR